MALTPGTGGLWTYAEPTGWGDGWGPGMDPMCADVARELYWAAVERAHVAAVCKGNTGGLASLTGVVADCGPWRPAYASAFSAIRDALRQMCGSFTDLDAAVADARAAYSGAGDDVEAKIDAAFYWNPPAVEWTDMLTTWPELQNPPHAGMPRSEAVPFALAARDALRSLRWIEYRQKARETTYDAFDTGDSLDEAKSDALDEERVDSRDGVDAAYLHGVLSAYDIHHSSSWRESAWLLDASALEFEVAPDYLTHPQDGGDLRPDVSLVALSCPNGGWTINGVRPGYWQYSCPAGWSEGPNVVRFTTGSTGSFSGRFTGGPAMGGDERVTSNTGFWAALSWLADYGRAFRFSADDGGGGDGNGNEETDHE